ncbi:MULTISPECIES: hypothetical protein [Streptococcus]|uniref:hypothetical protein n=1 Tax=Streptococcus TaxID=1301 RepID=UPI001EF7612B|nr:MULTISPECIES: hypothetical protein [Streptococcus]
MSKKFNKAFYRTWEFYLSVACILQVIYAAVNGPFWFIHFLKLGIGLYAGYLAFFKSRSWIKKNMADLSDDWIDCQLDNHFLLCTVRIFNV